MHIIYFYLRQGTAAGKASNASCTKPYEIFLIMPRYMFITQRI